MKTKPYLSLLAKFSRDITRHEASAILRAERSRLHMEGRQLRPYMRGYYFIGAMILVTDHNLPC